jgi:NAD(P)-dependent dehydrogenase (short-subunit alcohol dehydrogenase family)
MFLPWSVVKPLISFVFSVCLYFGLAIYQSYSQNEKITLPESRIQETMEKRKTKPADAPKGKQAKQTQREIVIVTGSTSGIGYNLAMELFRYGFHVIIASRSAERCFKAKTEIEKAYPDAPGALDYHAMDVGDFESVKEFVNWFRSKYTSLNYLVNNAGIHYTQGEDTKVMKTDTSILSKQGYDEVFATNYMGHFLLAYEFLPMIKQGRVVNIASGLHYSADGTTLALSTTKEHKGLIDAADGEKRGVIHRFNAYGVSKLAQTMHTHHVNELLKEQHREKEVQIVSVCPGWVKTGMIPVGPIGQIIFRFAFPQKAAILTPCMAMIEPSLAGGEFLTNYIMPLTQGKLGRMTLNAFTKVGLRDLFTGVLAIAIAIFESNSYGFHKSIPSDESMNKKAAKELYDWTLQEMIKKGFIVESKEKK